MQDLYAQLPEQDEELVRDFCTALNMSNKARHAGGRGGAEGAREEAGYVIDQDPCHEESTKTNQLLKFKSSKELAQGSRGGREGGMGHSILEECILDDGTDAAKREVPCTNSVLTQC